MVQEDRGSRRDKELLLRLRGEVALRAHRAKHNTKISRTVLHFTSLYCTVLHCTALHYTVLHCTTMQYSVLHYTALHCTAPYFIVVQTGPATGNGPQPKVCRARGSCSCPQLSPCRQNHPQAPTGPDPAL